MPQFYLKMVLQMLAFNLTSCNNLHKNGFMNVSAFDSKQICKNGFTNVKCFWISATKYVKIILQMFLEHFIQWDNLLKNGFTNNLSLCIYEAKGFR